MKKLFTLSLIILYTITYGQKIIVTPDGLKNLNDLRKTFVFIKVERKTAKYLYDSTLNYIIETYQNSNDTLKETIDGEFIKLKTHTLKLLSIRSSGTDVNIEAIYSINFSFRDEIIKLEIVDIEMYATDYYGYKVYFKGSSYQGFPIYGYKNVLKRPKIKTDIESYFNKLLNEIANQNWANQNN